VVEVAVVNHPAKDLTADPAEVQESAKAQQTAALEQPVKETTGEDHRSV
jgi:hypothetical protein